MEYDLFSKLCSYENLELAFKKAKKRKSTKQYVIDFENNLENNLLTLQSELIFHTYKPKPLKTFILRDPKTRKISKSNFRDRVIHHAVCNIIEPFFEKSFIYDSYANRKGKGNLKALERLDCFKRKVSKNKTRNCFIFKADIKHYFDEVDHDILVNIIKKKIHDKKVIWLIKTILENHHVRITGKGMPLGNLTSQFFANVYLNELDQFAKHILKVKYYIRYVDDFVILDSGEIILNEYWVKINDFLQNTLSIELHPDKCRIIKIKRGVDFLGFRIFYYHRLLRKSNMRKMTRRIKRHKLMFNSKLMNIDFVCRSFQGWLAYVIHADTYKLRKRFGAEIQAFFSN